MDVIEIRNPYALTVRDVQELLKRAVESGALLAPNGFDSVAEDIFHFVTDQTSFMLLGAEKGSFKSVVLGYYPSGNLFPYPTVVLMYNEGSKELLTATKEALLDNLVAHGYTKMLAVNSSGHTDKAWLKVLTPDEATSKIIGSLAMFEVS